MANINNYEKLAVWQNAVSIVTEIYDITKKFPKEELYGITSQIRRSALSIPSNIAEGSAKNSKKEFSRFLQIALGSMAELKTQLLISNNLEYFSNENYKILVTKLDKIHYMLIKLKESMSTKKTL